MSVMAFSVWTVKIGSSALNAKILPALHVRIHYGASFAKKSFVVTAKREFTTVPFVENHLAPNVKW
jgi:hypothetical protein